MVKRFFIKCKKDICILLAIILVLSLVGVTPTRASESMELVDYGKMIGIGYVSVEDNYGMYDYITLCYKNVAITDSGNIDLEVDEYGRVTNAYMTAEVYLEISADERYKVLTYTSDPEYYWYSSYDEDPIGLFKKVNGDGSVYYAASITPLYQYANGDTVEWGVNMYERQQSLRCDEAPYGGLSQEIIDYLVDNDIIPEIELETEGEYDEEEEYEGEGYYEGHDEGEGDYDEVNEPTYDKLYAALLDESLRRKLTVEYTLKDDEGNEETVIVKGESFSEFRHDTRRDSDYFGIRVDLNRIDSMSAYRSDGRYSHLKMYKGNLYVDADAITAQNGSLILPNANNSKLHYMNSMYFGDTTIYNDGLSTSVTETKYTLGRNCILNPVDTREEAIEKYFEYMNASIHDYDDFEDDEKYFDWKYYRCPEIYHNVNTYFKDSSYMYAISFSTSIMNIVKYEPKLFSEFAADVPANEVTYVFNKMKLPTIVFEGTEFSTNVEAYTYVEKYYRMVYMLSYIAGSNDDAYVITFTDGTTVTIKLEEVADLLQAIYRELITFADSPNIYDLEGDLYVDGENTEHAIGEIATFTPVSEYYETPSCYKMNLQEAFTYGTIVYDYSGMVRIVEAVGLSMDDFYGYVPLESIERERDEDAGTIVKAKITEYGIYDEVVDYIDENFVKQLSVTTFNIGDDSNKDTSVDVYGESLRIPFEKFANYSLGEVNTIRQLWYAGDFSAYMVPSLNGTQRENGIIYHKGEYIDRDYASVAFEPRNDEQDMLKYTILGLLEKYNYGQNMWSVDFADIVFAKVPAQIDEKEDIIVVEDEYTLEWEMPESNGAEIFGYQIAIVPHGANAPGEDDYIYVGEDAGSYTDDGDTYEVKWTTDNEEYVVDTEGKSVDVYVRAVNVIGAANARKISILNIHDAFLQGDDSVNKGEETEYEVFNGISEDVIQYFSFMIENSPRGVMIDASGKLTVTDECEVDSIKIVAVGMAGSDYEGQQITKIVTILEEVTTTTTESSTTTGAETTTTTESNTTTTEPGTTTESNTTTGTETTTTGTTTEPSTTTESDTTKAPTEVLVKVKVDSALDWDKVYIYSWDSNDGDKPVVGAWPGTEMTEVDGYYHIRITIPEGGKLNMIINNGKDVQTDDIKNVDVTNGEVVIKVASDLTAEVNPKTGDNTPVMWFMMIILLSGCIAVIANSKRKEEK